METRRKLVQRTGIRRGRPGSYRQRPPLGESSKRAGRERLKGRTEQANEGREGGTFAAKIDGLGGAGSERIFPRPGGEPLGGSSPPPAGK